MTLLRSDLPLDRDESGRFLPWIVGFMVYLAAMALAGSMVLAGGLSAWRGDLTGSMTVQLAPPPDGRGETRAARIDRVLELLIATPGIAGAEVLSQQELSALLEPWLGAAALGEALPMPDLIAVTLHPGAPLDKAALRQRLAEAVPGAELDDHQTWLADLVALARTAQLLAGAVLILVGAAAAATVVFATRTGLEIHRRVIEVVHLIGAPDSYIARQFQIHALRLGLLGGLAGAGLAALSLWALGALLRRLEAALLPPLALSPWQWLAIALLPLAAGLIAMVTARQTVLRALRRFM